MRVILQRAIKQVVRGFNQFPAAADVSEAAPLQPGPQAFVSYGPVAADDRAIDEVRRPARLNETARRNECGPEVVAAWTGQPVFRVRDLDPKPAMKPIVLQMRRRPFNPDVLRRQ